MVKTNCRCPHDRVYNGKPYDGRLSRTVWRAAVIEREPG